MNKEHFTYTPLSNQDFQGLGVGHIAYIKPVEERTGEKVSLKKYAIHSADGTQMAVVENLDVALAAIRQHGLEALYIQ